MASLRPITLEDASKALATPGGPVSGPAPRTLAPQPAASGDLESLINAIRGVESGGDPNAVSPVNRNGQRARGSMQVMPDTFKHYARPGEDYNNDEHRTAVAIRKLEDDFKFYGGDLAKVAAAYIGGRKAVLEDGTIRDDVKDALGTTPRAYAEKVLGKMGVAPAAGKASPAGAPAEEPAAPARAVKWSEITGNPKYQALDDAGKEAVRLDYWKNYVSPQIQTDGLEKARADFDRLTKPGMLQRLKDSVMGKPAAPADPTDAAAQGKVVGPSIAGTGVSDEEAAAAQRPARMTVSPAGQTKVATDVDTWREPGTDNTGAIAGRAAPDERGELSKGFETGVSGAHQIATAGALTPTVTALASLSKRLELYDQVDAGKWAPPKGAGDPARRGRIYAGPTDAEQRAQLYAVANPERRAQMREEELQSVAQHAGVRDSLMEAWQTYAAHAKTTQGKTVHFTDIRDAQGFTDWLAYNIGQGVPYLAASAVAGVLGAAVGGPPGAAVAIAGTEFGMGVGDIASEQLERGRAIDPAAATGYAVPYGAMGLIGAVPRAFRGVSQEVLEQVAEGYFKRVGKEAGKSAVEEFINEAGQEIIKDIAVAGKGEPIVTDESLLNWFNSGMAGAAVGGPAGGARAALQRPQREAGAAPTEPQAQPEPAGEPAPGVDLSDPAAISRAVAGEPPADPAEAGAIDAGQILGTERPTDITPAAPEPGQQGQPAAGAPQPAAQPKVDSPPAAPQATPAGPAAEKPADTAGIDEAAAGLKGIFEEPKGTGVPAVPPKALFHIKTQGDDGVWEDLGEGPFESRAEAEAFANAEVGVPYEIVETRVEIPGRPADGGETPSIVDQSAHAAATSPENDLQEPTDAQKEAGNYQKGHVRIGGLDISIENPEGSKRRPEWPTLKSHYGYIRGTVGKDKDHVDVFIKPGTPQDIPGGAPVFIVDQKKQGNGHFDEHKVMLGFDTIEEARAAYLENYTPGWDGIRDIVEMDLAEFKRWIRQGDTRAPAAHTLSDGDPETLTLPMLGKGSDYKGVPSAQIVLQKYRSGAWAGSFGFQTNTGGEGHPNRWDAALFDTRDEALQDAAGRLRDAIDSYRPLASEQSNQATPKHIAHIRKWLDALDPPEGPQGGTKPPPAAEPPATVSKQGEHKAIGKNAAGETIFEDLRGVRSIVRDGARITETVRLKPTAAGIQMSVQHEGEYLTKEESDAAEAGKQQPGGKPEHPGNDGGGTPAKAGGGGEPAQRGPAQEAQGADGALEGKRLSADQIAVIIEAATSKLLGPHGFTTITEARAWASERIGAPIKAGTMAAKQFDEALEVAIVLGARKLIARAREQNYTDKETYAVLRSFYDRQPNLNVRTSTSIRDQAYSTPVPLAFLASRLAGVETGTQVYEPTAGNGMLLIEAGLRPGTNRAMANELNPDRAAQLDALGFRVRRGDATDFDPRGNGVAAAGAEVVLANPPFGYVKDDAGRNREWKVDARYTTNQVDHAIAMKALAALRDDGKAVLIVGAPKEGQEDGYAGVAKRSFYFTLYRDYNVVDHFTVSGDLYAKQGAAWPVDVIVIHGRGKSALPLPQASAPRVYGTWEELTEKLHGPEAARGDRKPSPEAPAVGAGDRAPGAPAVGGGRARAGGGSGALVQRPAAPGSSRPDRVEPGAAGLDGGARGAPGQRPAGGELPGPDRPADAGDGRQLNVGQVFDEEFAALFGDVEKAPPRGGVVVDSPRVEIEVSEDSPMRLPPQFQVGELLEVVSGPYKGDVGVVDMLMPTPKGTKDDQVDYAVVLKKNGPVVLPGYMWRRAGSGGTAVVERIPKQAWLDAIDEAEGRGTSPALEASRKSAARAARESAAGLEDVAKGLTELFGGKGRVGSGLQFDEDTYAKAKPFFIAGIQHFKQAAADVREAIRLLLQHLREKASMTAEAIMRMKPYVVRFVEDVAAGKIPELLPRKRTPAAPAVRPQETETEHQRAYEPKSATSSIGSLVPANMQSSVRESLDALEAKVGDLDEFVAKELGYDPNDLGKYFSAEQVDALALALDSMKRGSGFIIGDQTGIGKGRVNAGIIRWAIRNDKVPIFVTEKPNLYGDIMRDLADIGMPGQRALMTNNNSDVPLDDEAALFYAEHEAEVEKAKAAGERPPRMPRVESRPGKWMKSTRQEKILQELTSRASLGDYQVVFTTYNQMQTVEGGKFLPRHDFLRAFADGAVVLFDESHNAGGTEEQQDQQRGGKKDDKPKRSDFARGLLAVASSVFYSSATYAKRPSVMDLYFRTDMAMAVDSVSGLVRAIQEGGVPLQQVVASMLAKAGQYIRREKSFAGIDYDTAVVKVKRHVAEKISATMKAITEFDKAKGAAVTAISEDIKSNAGSITEDGAIGQAGAHSTNFTSLMHNIVNQMLLALKTAEIADEVLASIRRGEKPVLTVANTMGSFIEDYVTDHGLNPGDAIAISFQDLMMRYLERSRDIVEGDPYGKKTRRRLSDAELGPEATALWNKIKQDIEDAPELREIPLSPIDFIKARIEKEGFKFGEITGRQHTVDYSGDRQVYRRRPSSATSIGGRKSTITQFNNGTLDVLLINQAGATGLSLHASEKFKDQRRRHMVIIQAEGNIDTHMQVLGRINRTGQVSKDGKAPKGKPAAYGLPRYTQLVADVPAEKRPAAVLAKKMASLNANTTASRGSAVTSKDVVDFMNQYGDEVAARMMEDNPEWHEKLDWPLPDAEKGDGFKVEDAMRKVTGRIPLLPLAEQEEIYDLLESEYLALIEEKDRLGENALEAKTLDLQAKTEKTIPVFEGKGGDSPFSAGAVAELVDVKKLGQSYTSEEVMGLLRTELELGESADLQDVLDAGQQDAEATIDKMNTDFTPFLQEALDTAKPASRNALQAKLMGMHDRLEIALTAAPLGRIITLKTRNGDVPATLVRVEKKGTPANPAALGAWRFTFAVADAVRHITLPATKLYTPRNAPSATVDPSAVVIDDYEVPEYLRGKPVLAVFDDSQSTAREKRVIITGNLLGGFQRFNRGRITNYTTADGELRQGILMPARFDIDKALNAQPIDFERADDAIAFLEHMTRKGQPTRLRSAEDKLYTVAQMGYGPDFRIAVAASREKGGKIFLNQDVLRAAGEDFVKAAQTMRADLPRARAVAALQAIMDAGNKLQATEHKQEAKDFLAGRKPKTEFAAAPPVSENMEAWLEGSKIKDPVYHITNRDLTYIEPGGTDDTVSGPAIWLAFHPDDTNAAHNVGGWNFDGNGPRYKDGANIMPLYARVVNPLEVTDAQARKISRERKWPGFPVRMEAAWIERLKDDGHDGVIYRRDPKSDVGADELVVFDSNQVKSVFNRNPTSSFDVMFGAAGWAIVDTTNDGENNVARDYPRKPRKDADIQRVLDLVAGNIRKRTGAEFPDGTLRAVRPTDPGTVLRLPDAVVGRGRDLSVAARVGQFFGQEVVFFENTRPNEVNFGGFRTDHAPGKIFVNIDAPRPALFIVGHELLHQMKAEAPAVFEKFQRAVRGMIQNRDSYEHALALNKDEEILADFTGWNIMKREFWNELSARERGMFGRIADYVRTFLDRIVAQFSAGTPASDMFISDVKAARTALVEAMKEWREAGAERSKTGTIEFAAAGARPAAAARMAKDTSFVDKVLSAPFKAMQWDRIAGWAWNRLDALNETLTDSNRLYETVRAGVESNYGLEDEYVDRRIEFQVNLQRWARGAKTMIDKIGELTRDESRVAYAWMNDREADDLIDDLPAESRRTLQDLKELIRSLGEEAVRLGQLTKEVFERNELAYLHRSYFKHEIGQTLAQKLGNRKAIAVWGEQYKGRGIKDWRTIEDLRRGDPELQQVGLKGKKFHRLELRAAAPEGVVGDLDAIGGRRRERLGHLRKVVYWPEGKAIPDEYAGWRNDGLWEARWNRNNKWGLWRDLNADERQALGEIDEVRFAVAKTLHLMTHDIEVGRMQAWVAETYGRAKLEDDMMVVSANESLASTFGRNTWVKVPDSKVRDTDVRKYGALAGLYVPGPVWNDLRQHLSLENQKGEIRKLWDDALRYWKISKTALSPGVHTNNVMANFFIADFHDLRAKDMVKALRVMLNAKLAKNPDQANVDLYRRFEDSGALHGMFKYHELRAEVLDPILEEIRRDALGNEQESMARVLSVISWLNAISEGAKKGAGAMIDAYSAEDEVFRLAIFIKGIRNGLNDLEAGKLSRKAFLDYDINAPWIQALRASAFPFIAFPYRAIPMMIDTFTHKPWKLIKYVGIAALLDTMAYAMLGMSPGDEERERALLPEERAGRVWGLFPKMLRMPWNSKAEFGEAADRFMAGDTEGAKQTLRKGHTVFLDVRRWFPGGDIFDVGQTHAVIPWSPTALPGGPMALLAELLLNKSSFTGQPITKPDTDTALQMASKVGMHLYRFAMPNLFMIPGTWSFEGLRAAIGFGEAGKTTDVFGREMSVPQSVGSAVGVKLGTYPEDVMRYNMTRRINALQQEIMQNIGKMQGERQRNKITDAELRDGIAREVSKIKTLQEDLRKKLSPPAR